MDPHKDFGSAANQPAHQPILPLRVILGIQPDHQKRVIDTAIALIRPDVPEKVQTLIENALREFQHCKSLPQNSVGHIASDLLRAGFYEVSNQIEEEQLLEGDNLAAARGYLSRCTLAGIKNTP